MTEKKPGETRATRRRLAFDAPRLRGLIEAGKTAPEIQAELGLTAAAFKAQLTKLIMQDRKFYEVAGLSARTRSTRPVYKKGGIKITPNMLKGLPFAEGDKFTISVEDGRLILAKD